MKVTHNFPHIYYMFPWLIWNKMWVDAINKQYKVFDDQ